MKEPKRISVFAKTDILIIALVLMLAAASFFLTFKNTSAPAYASVIINGEKRAEYPLDKTGRYKISGENGINIVLNIEDNGVSVETANCPDKICEKTGRITAAGQSIICMPGRISVTLESHEKVADAVAG